MEIIGQYTDGSQAVSHALKLVISYMKEIKDEEDKKELAKKYTPFLSFDKPKRSPKAVVVFDIDDTLLFDVDKGSIPHQVVVDFLLRLRQLNVEIHLITARLNDPGYFKETEDEVKGMGIKYETLTLAPEKARKNSQEKIKALLEPGTSNEYIKSLIIKEATVNPLMSIDFNATLKKRKAI
jgi:hypothetical protein